MQLWEAKLDDQQSVLLYGNNHSIMELRFHFQQCSNLGHPVLGFPLKENLCMIHHYHPPHWHYALFIHNLFFVSIFKEMSANLFLLQPLTCHLWLLKFSAGVASFICTICFHMGLNEIISLIHDLSTGLRYLSFAIYVSSLYAILQFLTYLTNSYAIYCTVTN